jgi:excisionase family DNA binding protein
MAEVQSVSEAARQLEVSAQTVRNLADRGTLPAMRTAGGQRLFRSADVERVRLERLERRTASAGEAT